MKQSNKYFMRKNTSYRTWIIYIALSLIIALFGVVLANEAISSSKYFENFINEDVILLQPTPSTSCYADSQEYCGSLYVPGKIAFSSEDVEKIKQIEGVKSVDAYGKQGLVSENYDGSGVEGGTTLDYSVEQYKLENHFSLNYITNSAEWNSDEVNDYKFVNFAYEPEKLVTYGSSFATYEGTQLLYGSYEDMEDNDIIIPNSLAVVWADETNVNVDDLVGKTIALPVETNGQKGSKNYVIAGVYEDSATNYNAIYTKYDPVWAQRMFIGAESTYKSWESEYNVDKEVALASPWADLYQPMFKDVSAYKAAHNDGIYQVIITVEPGSEAAVMEELAALFPDYYIINDNYIDANFVNPEIKSLVTEFSAYIGLIFASVAFVIIFYRRKILVSLTNELKNEEKPEDITKLVIRKQTFMWVITAIVVSVILIIINFIWNNVVAGGVNSNYLLDLMIIVLTCAIIPFAICGYAILRLKPKKK